MIARSAQFVPSHVYVQVIFDTRIKHEECACSCVSFGQVHQVALAKHLFETHGTLEFNTTAISNWVKCTDCRQILFSKALLSQCTHSVPLPAEGVKRDKKAIQLGGLGADFPDMDFGDDGVGHGAGIDDLEDDVTNGVAEVLYCQVYGCGRNYRGMHRHFLLKNHMVVQHEAPYFAHRRCPTCAMPFESGHAFHIHYETKHKARTVAEILGANWSFLYTFQQISLTVVPIAPPLVPVALMAPPPPVADPPVAAPPPAPVPIPLPMPIGETCLAQQYGARLEGWGFAQVVASIRVAAKSSKRLTVTINQPFTPEMTVDCEHNSKNMGECAVANASFTSRWKDLHTSKAAYTNEYWRKMGCPHVRAALCAFMSRDPQAQLLAYPSAAELEQLLARFSDLLSNTPALMAWQSKQRTLFEQMRLSKIYSFVCPRTYLRE